MDKATIKKTRELEIELFDLWYGNEHFDYEETGQTLSPIEKIFFMNCHRCFFGSAGPWNIGELSIGNWDVQPMICKETGKTLDAGSGNISKPHYRIDFILYFWNALGTADISIAIELDGHDFHERTKEQAKRDKQKDIFLQKNGYLIARFTGSEVYNDPEDCVNQVWRMAAQTFNRKIRIANV